MDRNAYAYLIYKEIMDDIDPYRQGEDETNADDMISNLENIMDDIEDYSLNYDIQVAIDKIKAL